MTSSSPRLEIYHIEQGAVVQLARRGYPGVNQVVIRQYPRVILASFIGVPHRAQNMHQRPKDIAPRPEAKTLLGRYPPLEAFSGIAPKNRPMSGSG
jgi:hypothetical protein